MIPVSNRLPAGSASYGGNAVKPDQQDLHLKKTTGDTIRPMMGNEAIARGVWEAGVKVASAYPGTPSTEILENIARYPDRKISTEWATNEKVALDIAMGASFAGVRSFCAMKHVGLNVASDALMSITYIGVNGGLVLAVCDDPGIHSSQNEQDTRLFARLAMVPCLDPSDAQEALDYVRLAFDISEKFDTPVIVRSSTRLSHTRSPVILGERQQVARRPFDQNPVKNVMIPSHARMRHPLLLEREAGLRKHFAGSELTRIEKGRKDIGVVTFGVPYSYVKEVLPDASILKLGYTYPLPETTLTDFAKTVDRLFVVEELGPVVEHELQRLGVKVEGKKWFPRTGEFSPEIIRAGFQEAGVLDKPEARSVPDVEPLVRPPVLCAGCPHIGSYTALRDMDARVAGDIGCYTLAAVEPLKAIDTCVSMGSSIANATGMARAGLDEKPIVATIGDSTFLHAGIPPLIDAVYNNVNITVVILDNAITAMTGGQHHPGTGYNIHGEKTHKVAYEDICRAVGVKWLRKIDPYDAGAVHKAFREAVEFKGVSVVIVDRPCVLDPVKIKGPALQVKAETCIACQSCMNLGCPALSWSEEWHEGHHKVTINESTCIGCSMCAQICPVDSIQPVLAQDTI